MLRGRRAGKASGLKPQRVRTSLRTAFGAPAKALAAQHRGRPRPAVGYRRGGAGGRGYPDAGGAGFCGKAVPQVPRRDRAPGRGGGPGSCRPGRYEEPEPGSKGNDSHRRLRLHPGRGGGDGAPGGRLRAGAFLPGDRAQHRDPRQPDGAVLHGLQQPGPDPHQRLPGREPPDRQQSAPGQPGNPGAEEPGGPGGGGRDLHLRH